MEDFRLRATRLKRTAWITIAVGTAYYALLVLYSVLIELEPDSTPVKLGADNGDIGIAGLVFAAVLLAPIAEEIFFRGMIFRSLQNGVGVVPAAAISGAFFGLLHWDFATLERLLQVIPLIGFGVALALLYAWSGSLWGSIVLHGTNNALASGGVAFDRGSERGVAGCHRLMYQVCYAPERRFTSRRIRSLTLRTKERRTRSFSKLERLNSAREVRKQP